MATVSYTSLLGLALPTPGDLSGTWGSEVNSYITTFLDSAVAGVQTISGTQTAVTLSVTNGSTLVSAGAGATGSSQYMVINCTGTPASLLTITAPAASKVYVVINGTAQSVKLVGAGPTTGVTLITGEKAVCAWNGSDFVKVASSAVVGGIVYTTTKTANYTAVANDGVLTNTTAGAFTVTLPASPSNGAQVIVADAAGTWGTNNLTVGRNGNNIADVAQDLVCDIGGVSVQFVYNSSGTASWEVFAQVGGNGGTVVTLDGTQTLTNKTLTAPTIASANLTTALTLAGAAGTNGQVLTSAGSGLPTWSAVPGASLQEFTSSGTYTKPSGCTFVMVEARGGGGGGGSGRRGATSTTRNGGSAGGGGAYTQRLFKATDLTSTVTVTLGAGGTAGAAVTVDSTDGNAGTVGGNTTFGAFLTAFGGGRSTLGSAGAVPGGGGGGVLSAGAINVGGQPFSIDLLTVSYGQFGGARDDTNPPLNGLPSGFGGGSGGGSSSGLNVGNGGCSFQGGPGGGSGGNLSTGNASTAGGAGGSITGSNGGGAAAGAAPATSSSAGGNGTAGTGRQGGGGGGAGGSVSGVGGTGGAGGANSGAGGGGGGASFNGSNSGAGGAGAAGYVIVYSW